jgi:hypothetical protein
VPPDFYEENGQSKHYSNKIENGVIIYTALICPETTIIGLES